MEALEVIEFLKKQVETDYFEQLIQKYLLDNTHAAVVIVEPQYGLNAKKEEKLAKELEAYKNSLSEAEKQEIVDFTHHLKKYQEEPSAPEDLDKIPTLAREDIKKDAEKLYIREKYLDDTLMLCHDVETNGIAYFSLMFDVTDMPAHLIPYMGLMKAVLGYVDTEHYTFQELANEINLYTGGIFSNIGSYAHVENNTVSLKYEIKAKTLYKEIPKTFEIIREILTSSNYKKQERLYEILAQLKSRLQMSMSSAGHSISAMRAMSYFSVSGKYSDMTEGIEFYQLVKELEEHFEEKKDQLSKTLEELAGYIFRKDNLMISAGAQPEGLELLEKEIPKVKQILKDAPKERETESITLEKLSLIHISEPTRH